MREAGIVVIGLLTLVTGLLWGMLVNADERQWVLDNTCPVRATMVRYPAHLGGPHPAICNPTGVNWR